MTISIFPKTPFEIQNRSDDPQAAAYHFDAIVKIDADASVKYTSYPIEFGADMQDHAYNEPTKLTVYGYQGSQELRMSVNQLPELGASAAIGNLDNPYLAAAVGFGAGLARANVAHLAGDTQTRGAQTLSFLNGLKESFVRFDVQTGLELIRNLKIDKIHTSTTPDNETGLEFVVEMSQMRFMGQEQQPDRLAGKDLSKIDSALIQAAPMLDRGRISLV